MQNNKTPIVTYLIYSVFSAAIYGLFAFFVIYRGLAGGAILYAYLWSIIVIYARRQIILS